MLNSVQVLSLFNVDFITSHSHVLEFLPVLQALVHLVCRQLLGREKVAAI